ncbi:glutamate-5-semialdehyde dehydrogenase [Niabella ginsengisoli]|uniref:Gamma-glutamyl phosphate reductase n=1 Tax=Niabella ginsengisoli TaxID=522298 RepID=A0ABS9SFD1_9BACT|nr:glutamate-5-semialdehyde dehydrogenase [Niabella ginsengisoli]MCH5597060.1 glutamate-5-semialdehyde dehydrogenase [Niabella ginsengisoli]
MLHAIANGIIANEAAILTANQKDLATKAINDPKNDRLMLNSERLKNIAKAIKKIAGLPDPTGAILLEKTLPNGILLKKIAVPLGVVGAIYESRPNVTYDIAALCLRSRNACVLKGSSDAQHTNKVSIGIIQKALKEFGLDANTVCLLPPQREIVQEMFTATKYIDVLIPRGSEGLINFVRQNSLVPVIETGAGVCHVYVEQSADLQKAVDIVVNAKVSRPSVCNAVDAIIVDQKIAADFLPLLAPRLAKHEVEIFADAPSYKNLKGYPHLFKAKAADFGREFISLKCAIKTVKNIDEALSHISKYSTKHSEAIVSKDKKAQQRFVTEVDAAAVYTNASTRFTDGEEFGLGAEIGISTQKLHARGPFALEKLVTEKWILEGNGQVR